MVKAEHNADMMFTLLAMSVTSGAMIENNLPIIMKNGAPGGWPTKRLFAVAMNSPQSQKLAESSVVNMYVMAETKKATHPHTLFHKLYCFIYFVIYYVVYFFLCSLNNINFSKHGVASLIGSLCNASTAILPYSFIFFTEYSMPPYC